MTEKISLDNFGDILHVSDLSKIFALHPQHICKKLRSGQLPFGKKPGREWIAYKSSVIKYLESDNHFNENIWHFSGAAKVKSGILSSLSTERQYNAALGR